MNLLILGSMARDYERLLKGSRVALRLFVSEGYEREAEELADKAQIILSYKFTDDILKRAKGLRWIQLMSAGAEQVVCSPHIGPGVIITAARGVHSPQMAEYTMALILALARGLPQMMANQGKRLWKRRLPRVLKGSTIGIIGFGAVGQEVARYARAFGMRVIGMRRSGEPHVYADEMLWPDGLKELLSTSDYVVIAAPLTPETQGLIGAAQCNWMKRDAFLINVARGGIVDEGALASASSKGQIAGAALDVYKEEPLPEDSPLWEAPNLIIAPHVGGMGPDYAKKVVAIFIENYRRLLAGEPMINVVDRARGY